MCPPRRYSKRGKIYGTGRLKEIERHRETGQEEEMIIGANKQRRKNRHAEQRLPYSTQCLVLLSPGVIGLPNECCSN